MTYTPQIPSAAGTLTGTTLASNVVSSSLTSVGTLATATIGTGEATLIQGNVKRGGMAQGSGSAIGFNIFSPAANIGYFLQISGKDVADGVQPTNTFVDQVALSGVAGWAPVSVSSSNTLGAPGARTYTNNAGNLRIATTGIVTWYIDITVVKFAS